MVTPPALCIFHWPTKDEIEGLNWLVIGIPELTFVDPMKRSAPDVIKRREGFRVSPSVSSILYRDEDPDAPRGDSPSREAAIRTRADRHIRAEDILPSSNGRMAPSPLPLACRLCGWREPRKRPKLRRRAEEALRQGLREIYA